MDRLSAAIAYIPILGWLYVLIFKRQEPLPMFHVRQSIGLFLYLLLMLAGWFVFFWVMAWVPFGALVSVTFFTLVVAAFFFGVVAWVIGIVNALRGEMIMLPLVGRNANRLSL